MQGAFRKNRDAGHIDWPVPDDLNQCVADIWGAMLQDEQAVGLIKVLLSAVVCTHGASTFKSYTGSSSTTTAELLHVHLAHDQTQQMQDAFTCM